ncbi:hypothetical protein JCGZ_15269 [Jatropha curcas]|uniref:Uncharacterized protein n=1 Tax=Jatropha curcas TaxID=180498 RepID=A0A067KE78_JATCU|nr:hypothetical protein JCGZ_15269 [Jatropha curcas]
MSNQLSYLAGNQSTTSRLSRGNTPLATGTFEEEHLKSKVVPSGAPKAILSGATKAVQRGAPKAIPNGAIKTLQRRHRLKDNLPKVEHSQTKAAN